MTAYLTVQQLLFLHDRLIAETGGEHTVRDLDLLQSAIARPQATFDGADLYVGLPAKAAALMLSIVGNHPFVDGNKRTGIAAAALFLLRNGYTLDASNADVDAFTMAVAEARLSFDEIARWLAGHSRPAP